MVQAAWTATFSFNLGALECAPSLEARAYRSITLSQDAAKHMHARPAQRSEFCNRWRLGQTKYRSAGGHLNCVGIASISESNNPRTIPTTTAAFNHFSNGPAVSVSLLPSSANTFPRSSGLISSPLSAAELCSFGSGQDVPFLATSIER